jgi:hypothetical protein
MKTAVIFMSKKALFKGLFHSLYVPLNNIAVNIPALKNRNWKIFSF